MIVNNKEKSSVDGLDEFPKVSEVLLKALNNSIPERCPELDWTDRMVWFYSGQRSVVRLLEKKYEQQNENILVNS
jgi:hypothetical protein